MPLRNFDHTMSNINKYIEVVTKGKYYFQAGKAYNDKDTKVNCDRCMRNVPACINHKDIDICLMCADYVTRMLDDPPSPSSEKCLATMIQDMYNSRDETDSELSFMEMSLFD